jgi:hypothetical protein
MNKFGGDDGLMKLRPQLMPPALDGALVAHLARLADRLDGAQADQCDDELAEFNRLAGTALAFKEFQGIYKAVDPEDWVRGVLYRRSLKPIPDLSRAEMVEIVSRVMACGDDRDFYVELFVLYCKHPSESDLIFWPNLVPELPGDREPTAEEIADCALNWQPRVVAMKIMQRSGGKSVGYYLYQLEAPDTPPTQVVTSLDTVYEKGAVVAVALKGVRLDDGSFVDTTFRFGPMSCGKLLGATDKTVGSRIR